VTGPGLRILTAVVEGGRLRDPGADSRPVPWWSLTKSALAAAALALVGAGKLALDRQLSERPFTLRQLLQHTAGVPDYGGLRGYHEAVARGDAPWSDERLLTRVDAGRLLFPPGQGWAYSNVGYLLVRRLIEQAAGDDLDAALRRLVFAPLDVSGVRLAREPADLVGTAWGNAIGYHPGWVYHGLLLGAPAAAALFLHRLLTGRLLPPGLLGVMTEPRPLGGPVPGRPWRTAGYGLGLMIDVSSPRGRCLGHTGQGPGSTAAAYHFPDLEPLATAAAFAPVEDQAVVEEAVLGVTGAGRSPRSPRRPRSGRGEASEPD
jgi:D-alanyl-D-alanine carboxypeptidase